MSQENPSSQLDVEFIYLPVINYSMQQNRIPVVRLLSIKNNTEHPLADLKVFLICISFTGNGRKISFR